MLAKYFTMGGFILAATIIVGFLCTNTAYAVSTTHKAHKAHKAQKPHPAQHSLVNKRVDYF